MTEGGDGAPPQSWSLTAELAPKSGSSASGQDPVKTDVLPPEWAKGADAVRTTVKWTVGILGAIGAALFAKGLIATPDLNWTDDRLNLIAAWCLGAVGLLGLGWLVHEAVSVLRPNVFELGNLPAAYIAVIDADPTFYLPGGVPDTATFIRGYQRLRREEASGKAAVVKAQRALADASKAEPTGGETTKAARLQLDKAQIPLTAVEGALEVYVEVRQALVDRASFWSAAQVFSTADTRMLVAAFLAAVGGIGYQLALAPAGPADDDDKAPVAARVATLMRTDTKAGRELWRQLGLKSCQSASKRPRIRVVVSDGDGSADNPYVVSTLPPRKKCAEQTFTVINDVAQVSKPKTNVITYSPAATPSQSPAVSSSTSSPETPNYPPPP